MRGCANCGSSSAAGDERHVILTLSVAKGKDLLLRAVRSFAVFAAQDDGLYAPVFSPQRRRATEAFVISVSLW